MKCSLAHTTLNRDAHLVMRSPESYELPVTVYVDAINDLDVWSSKEGRSPSISNL